MKRIMVRGRLDCCSAYCASETGLSCRLGFLLKGACPANEKHPRMKSFHAASQPSADAAHAEPHATSFRLAVSPVYKECIKRNLPKREDQLRQS